MSPYEPAPPTPPAGPVPGWYVDPADPALQRYWDGAAWTTHTAPLVHSSWQAAPAAPQVYGGPAYGGTAYAEAGWGVQPRQVGFGDAVRRAFRGWSDYSGRATVGEYWWFYLVALIATLVPYVLFMVGLFALLPSTVSSSSSTQPLAPREAPSTGLVVLLVVLGIVFFAVMIVLFLVQLALTVRRLHDTDREGWWYLISLVPFGGFVLLYFLVLPGTPGPNRYGPVPT